MIYIEANKGVDTESEYTWAEGMAPNPPPKFACWKQAAARHAATIFNHSFVKVGDEAQMAAALLISPLATAVDADSNTFQLYKTGVIKAGQGCHPSGAAPNNAVTIVGMTATSYIVGATLLPLSHRVLACSLNLTTCWPLRVLQTCR